MVVQTLKNWVLERAILKNHPKLKRTVSKKTNFCHLTDGFAGVRKHGFAAK